MLLKFWRAVTFVWSHTYDQVSSCFPNKPSPNDNVALSNCCPQECSFCLSILLPVLCANNQPFHSVRCCSHSWPTLLAQPFSIRLYPRILLRESIVLLIKWLYPLEVSFPCLFRGWNNIYILICTCEKMAFLLSRSVRLNWIPVMSSLHLCNLRCGFTFSK